MTRVSPGALVLAAAIPLLFLHVVYQPGFGVRAGSTTVNAYLSDFAVLAVVVAAVLRGLGDGFGPLARGRWLWAAGAAFLAWMVAEVVHGHLHTASYDWHAHGVTAAKFAEYALLAPAVPLLVRRAEDLLAPLWSLVVWSSLATAVGIAQFFGAAIFFPGAVGHRQASFLSSADFAALSGAALLVGIAATAVPGLGLGRSLQRLATATGVLGMILAGAMASVLGLATALVVVTIVLAVRRRLESRRLVAAAAAGLIVLAGAVAIRGSDLDTFARFIGASPQTTQQQQQAQQKVQTYAHRTLLTWIGIEIWKDNPLIGVGWEGSSEPGVFGRYLPAAHARFPDEAPLAFPAADRRYGVQDVWVQALADLGVVGFLLWAALFVTAAGLAVRATSLPAPAPAFIGLLWVALLVWLWAAQSYVAGIPLDALTWLAFGLTATRFAQPGEASR